MLKLYFLRHGQADWPGWTKPDDERPLTNAGKKEMRGVAKFLSELGVNPRLILSSPLPRAFQTAKIAAKQLGIELRDEPALAKGFDLSKLRRILRERKDCDLMLVGHEPDLSAVLKQLTGGRVKMAKAGIARVDLEDRTSVGRLIWLFPPKMAKRKKA